MADGKTKPLEASSAEVVYVDDQSVPGIQRLRRGRGFAYRFPDGRWLRPQDPGDRQHLERIRALAVPPAYDSVWICPWPDGHLQATGRDARGRKQYRYHPSWRMVREKDKFDRMVSFGQSLTTLRQGIARALGQRDSPGEEARARLLSALVRLLDSTCIRIGSPAYVRENNSFGLTTLRNRHATVRGHTITFRFRGKSGISHEIALSDPRLARIVRCCQVLPGKDLFQYEDEQGEVHGVGPTEVNAHIRALCGADHTAKDFRTWHASVHAWSLLAPKMTPSAEHAANRRARVREVTQALEEVASRLGNTPAVCKKSYIHPMILQCALEGSWPEVDRKAKHEAQPGDAPSAATEEGLSGDEQGFLAFLRAAGQHKAPRSPRTRRPPSSRRARA